MYTSYSRFYLKHTVHQCLFVLLYPRILFVCVLFAKVNGSSPESMTIIEQKLRSIIKIQQLGSLQVCKSVNPED